MVTGRFDLVAVHGVDVVAGAPEAAVVRDGTIEPIDNVGRRQPHAWRGAALW